MVAGRQPLVVSILTDSVQLLVKVSMKKILNTGNFDMEQAAASAGWLQSLKKNPGQSSEAEEYGITSFVYR